MAVLSTCMSVPHMHAVPTEAKEHWVPWNWYCSEPLCGYWELNLGPLVDQPVFLTNKSSPIS